MTEPLDVSRSVLYQIFRQRHRPSPAVRKRICRNLHLPPEIWDKKHHETCHDIYEAFRVLASASTGTNPGSPAARPEHQEETLSDIL